MLDTIKRYELADGVDIDLLKKVGFSKLETRKEKFFLSWILRDTISMNISITKKEDSLYFDDIKSICIVDDEFSQPYTPFYGNREFDYLNSIIIEYNECMDRLVNLGILKEKEKQKVKTK